MEIETFELNLENREILGFIRDVDRAERTSACPHESKGLRSDVIKICRHISEK